MAQIVKLNHSESLTLTEWLWVTVSNSALFVFLNGCQVASLLTLNELRPTLSLTARSRLPTNVYQIQLFCSSVECLTAKVSTMRTYFSITKLVVSMTAKKTQLSGLLIDRSRVSKYFIFCHSNILSLWMVRLEMDQLARPGYLEMNFILKHLIFLRLKGTHFLNLS